MEAPGGEGETIQPAIMDSFLTNVRSFVGSSQEREEGVYMVAHDFLGLTWAR
jgi:hypothetical protein